MKTRVAVIGIIVQNKNSVEKLNKTLSNNSWVKEEISNEI